MKADRRHQLQTNELARQLETFPETLKRHANKIILAVTVLVVVIFFLRYRNEQQQMKRLAVANAMAVAQTYPAALRSLDWQNLAPREIAQRRKQVIEDTNDAIETLLRDAEGDNAAAMRAEAMVARGDLNWSLANALELPGATTEPALKLPRAREEYLKTASDAYADVVRSYASQITAWTSAQFGLAAIAENRGEWDKAKEIYNAVIANKDVPESFRFQATVRVTNILPQIRNPVLIGAFGTPVPTTQSATTAATTQLSQR
jgi:hypothetical protein